MLPKVLVIIVATAGVGGAVYVGHHFWSEANDNEKAEDLAAVKSDEKQRVLSGVDIAVTAKELATDYGVNEVATDAKYKGKVIAVDGKLARVARTGNSIVVILNPKVYCAFVGEEFDLTRLSIGERIVVRGIGIGVRRDLDAPTLASCVLDSVYSEPPLPR